MSKCSIKWCESKGVYVSKDDIKVLFCGDHKKEKMIYVIRLCRFEGCNVSGSFKIEGVDGYFCATHKPEDSIKMKCFHNDCKGEGKYIDKNTNKYYCVDHKPLEIKKHDLCTEPGCEFNGGYKEPGTKGDKNE